MSDHDPTKFFEDPLEQKSDTDLPELNPDAGGRLKNLTRRGWLTLRHLGLREFVWRIITFPLRYTRFGPQLGYGNTYAAQMRRYAGWYRRNGRPVTIVIPTYGPVDTVVAALDGIRKTVPKGMFEVILADDASAPE